MPCTRIWRIRIGVEFTSEPSASTPIRLILPPVRTARIERGAFPRRRPPHVVHAAAGSQFLNGLSQSGVAV